MSDTGSEQKESVPKTDPKYCEKTYGDKFTHCNIDMGEDCCVIGDQTEEKTEETNETRIDCVKEHGEKWKDCKRDWGWDCCMKDDPIKTFHEKPIGCTKVHGDKFVDCETKWGWDCCFVGDPLDENELDTNEEIIFYTGEDTCSKKLGPEFTDCGNGYGLDCCYVDDGVFKYDKDHGEKSGPIKDSHALKHFEAFYQKVERASCVEQYGEQWTDCGNTFGLDCCYIDDGILFHNATIDRAIHRKQNFDTLRAVVMLAVIAFVVINRLQVFISKQSKESGKKVTLDDGEDDDNKDDEVELKPLI